MKLASIHIHPVKACRGIERTEARVVARGLEHDRRFLVIDSNGLFVTQRREGRLALVDTAIEGDSLRLSAPGTGEVVLPLHPERGMHTKARVWRDEVESIEVPEGSRFFRDHLGADVRLVFMPDTSLRPVDPERARPGDVVSFADAYPFLLASEASLEDLNQRLPSPLSMSRFRPNLVVAGAEPYAEDRMARLRIGGMRFRGVKCCDRCTVTTIDPATGLASHEPLRTLATYRKWDGKVWFGMNLVHEGEGLLRVGDPVEVDEWRDSPPSHTVARAART